MLSENKPEIVPLFATPLFKTFLPLDNLKDSLMYLDGVDMLIHPDAENHGQHSKITYILDEKECAPLRELLISMVNDFAKNVLLYVYDGYAISQSWVSHKYPGQHHNMHTHPNSLISGVFYFGDEDAHFPAITFHKLVTGVNASYFSPLCQSDRRKSVYAQETFSVSFSPGLLLLFPSHVFHSVPVNRTNVVRKSLSFNVLPKGKIGSKQGLTELLFEKLI